MAAGGNTSVGPPSAVQGEGEGEAVPVVRGLTVEVDLAGVANPRDIDTREELATR